MKPTVWHLCSNRWNSAITEYALRSAQALSMRGWHSRLSALPGSPCAKRSIELGAAGETFRFKLGDLPALRKEAKRLKPAFIITYGGPETFLARFLGAPVLRFRGQDSDMVKELKPFELKLNLGFCRAILTPAEVVAARFRSVVPKMNIKAITLGLDASIFYARPRKSADRPRILIVGRLDPIKGHEKFLELFHLTLQEWDTPRPKPYLEIIGQSSNITAAQLRAFAKSLGLTEGVDWGLVDARVPNLPERMSSAALGVVPSLGSEVICRVTEEFLLAGTPVLVAPVGSLAECLKDESFGSILPGGAKDHELLQKWSLRAFDERDEDRKARSEKAKQYFSLESMGEALEQYLLGLK